MTDALLRTRMLNGEMLAGTFMKTPAHELIELLAMSGLDFVALDAEHAPFDRGRMDACLAMARALKFPVLVRTPDGSSAAILNALDCGGTGIVVPHVASVEKAREIAKLARFGHGGRGFAGSTRWGGFATRPMADLMQQSKEETIVIAQIEEPEAVDAIDEIAAVEGIDGLFVGPADLAVCLGASGPAAPEVRAAIGKVGEAAHHHNRACITFAPNTDDVAELKKLGVSVFFIGSEQGMMLAGAKAIAAGVKANA
ncbi:MAG: HpcH/HpaI aldolase family protein [Hyphomicrobiales bacterium]